MKNNKVRMSISRDMHEWFASIDGKTNDERMIKLKNNRDVNRELVSEIESAELMKKYWFEEWVMASSNNAILKRLLSLSITVSIISLGYLSYAQGWFL